MPQSPHHLRNDLKCVEWDVKPCSIQSNLPSDRPSAATSVTARLDKYQTVLKPRSYAGTRCSESGVGRYAMTGSISRTSVWRGRWHRCFVGSPQGATWPDKRPTYATLRRDCGDVIASSRRNFLRTPFIWSTRNQWNLRLLINRITRRSTCTVCDWMTCAMSSTSFILHTLNFTKTYDSVVKTKFFYFSPRCMEMPARTSDEKGVCLSVCRTRELWQNGRILCPDFYTVWQTI